MQINAHLIMQHQYLLTQNDSTQIITGHDADLFKIHACLKEIITKTTKTVNSYSEQRQLQWN